MKFLVILILGIILGVSFSFLIFKKISLSEVIRIHGLKSSLAPEEMIIYNNDSGQLPVKLPIGTTIYYVKSADESYDQCILFINIENYKLNYSPTGVKNPLIGIVRPSESDSK